MGDLISFTEGDLLVLGPGSHMGKELPLLDEKKVESNVLNSKPDHDLTNMKSPERNSKLVKNPERNATPVENPERNFTPVRSLERNLTPGQKFIHLSY